MLHFPRHSRFLTIHHTLTPIALACAAMSVVAQDKPPAQTTGNSLETVVITGFRSANQKTIAAKRDSAVVTDGVVADDIGKLPDFNVGDALKRVTGVNTLEYQGEPRFIIVRGLNANYNTTLINGFSFATTDVGSRQVLMEVLPSNFVHRIDVTKSFLPENDGGSIGGTTNLITASGFNYPDGTFTLSAKGGYNLMGSEYGGKTPVGEAAGKWAKRFGSANEFAFLGTASYWQRHIYVPQIEAGGSLNWYNANGTRSSTPYGGNGIAVPIERRWYNYDNERNRAGVTGQLNWRPEGWLTGSIGAYYFKQNEKSFRATQNAQVQNAAVVTNQTPTSGTFNNVQQYVELGRLRWERQTYGVNGELKAEIAPLWTGDLRGSVSRATSKNPQTWDKFQLNNQAFNYDWSGPTPTFSAVNPATTNDASRYTNEYRQEEQTGDYVADVTDLQINVRHNVADENRGLGFAFGARAVQTKSDTSAVRTNWNKMGYTLADVQGPGTCGDNCNTPLMTIDPARADDFYGRFAGSVRPVDDAVFGNGNTYGIKENVLAAYAQTQYRLDRFLVAGGLRFEHTEFESYGFQQLGTAYSRVTGKTNYSNVLPSVGGFYDTAEESKLRFGISRTIGRPRFDQMGLKGSVLNRSGGTLTRSNPDLKPRQSDNFDLGHEWYFDSARSMFSVAVFHKNIKDEIFRFGENQTIDGERLLVIQPRNVDGKVKITGLELGLIKELGHLAPALRGFTVSANLTMLDAKYPISLGDGTSSTLSVLPEQPKRMFNLALYYEDGPIHAKLAWNYTGKLWDDRFPNYTSQAEFYRNRYQQATNKVDLKVTYDLSRTVALDLDILNITSQGYQYNYGKSQEYVQSTWKVAPTVMLGLNVKL